MKLGLSESMAMIGGVLRGHRLEETCNIDLFGEVRRGSGSGSAAPRTGSSFGCCPVGDDRWGKMKKGKNGRSLSPAGSGHGDELGELRLIPGGWLPGALVNCREGLFAG